MATFRYIYFPLAEVLNAGGSIDIVTLTELLSTKNPADFSNCADVDRKIRDFSACLQCDGVQVTYDSKSLTYAKGYLSELVDPYLTEAFRQTVFADKPDLEVDVYRE